MEAGFEELIQKKKKMLVLRNPLLPDPVTWDYFVTEFNTKYVTNDYKESKWKKFLTLRQGKMTVAGYEKEFSRLSKYAPESVLIVTPQTIFLNDFFHGI